MIPKPPIGDLVASLPHHSTERYVTRRLDEVALLVVHHSATPETITAERIAAYHVERLGWPGIGYHFVVSPGGTLYQVNALTTVSYHVGGHNRPAVGICFVGNFMKAPPLPAQLAAGAHLCAWLLQRLGLEPGAVVGHRDLMATACPGNQWVRGARWKETLLQEIEACQTNKQEMG